MRGDMLTTPFTKHSVYVTGFGKPSVRDPYAIRAMHVLVAQVEICQSRFCHIHVELPFSHLLPSFTEASCAIQRRNKPSF